MLCHHGLFWNFHPRSLTPAMKRRLGVLFDADISLAAYHLPLDAHAERGQQRADLRSAWARARRALRREPRTLARLGGPLSGGRPLRRARDRCESLFGQQPLVWDGGPEVVHSVGVISGAAASSLGEAVARGLDAFLTGEPAEHAMADAREAGVHFLACGHYATETFGVRRLGDLIEERFGIVHKFVDVPNPI